MARRERQRPQRGKATQARHRRLRVPARAVQPPPTPPRPEGWNPSPLTVLLIIIGCILLLGMITAAIKVFFLG